MSSYLKFKIAFVQVFFLGIILSCEKKDAPSADIQGVSGRITDKKTAKPIAKAIVELSNTQTTVGSFITTDDGYYSFRNIQVGDYTLKISATAYRSETYPVIVSIGKSNEKNIPLELELPKLEFNPANVSFSDNEKSKTIYLKNVAKQGPITINLKVPDDAKWVSISKTSITIPENQQDELTIAIDTRGKGFGSYSSGIILNYSSNYNTNSDIYQVTMIVANPQAPTVSTGIPYGITQTTANLKGTITNTGGSTITKHGICWSEGGNPTPEADSKEEFGGSGIGTFVGVAKNLVANKKYFVRAYAFNTNGVGYGDVVQFTTSAIQTAPAVTLSNLTNVNHNSATLTGKMVNDGGSNISEQGFCWNSTGNPKVTENKILATPDNSGSFSAKIGGLNTGITYYVRAYAINNNNSGEKTGYSNEESFKTAATIASLITTSANSITSTSAKAGGSISSDGGANITTKGICWDTKTSPTVALNTKTNDGIGSGNFTSDMSGLAAGVKYYVRAYANNSVGTSYGNEVSFTTSASLATLTTTAISALTSNSSKSGGNITAEGGAITSRGVCWSTSPNPTVALTTKTTNGTGSGGFVSDITDLKASTKYYVRAYATNSAGTAYGNEVSFTTPEPFAIGQEYGGGIIFYLDGTKQHGLIAAKKDAPTAMPWYNGKYLITGANKSEIGGGQSNTKKIIEVLGDGDYAAMYCDKLLLNNYDDWYLPSKKELDLLYSTLENRVGGLDNKGVIYWSSTENGEVNIYSGGAYVTSYYSFIEYSFYTKNNFVRPIRTF